MAQVRQFTPAQLRGNLHFLLDFEWAGRTVHLAQQRLTAAIGAGDADVAYYPGLEWSRSQRRSFSLGSPMMGASIDVTLYLADHVDVPTLVNEGHPLGSARGRLLLWPEDSSDYMVVLDGVLRNEAWSSREMPITGTLEEEPFMDTGLIPGVNERVIAPTGGATWTAFDTSIGGEYYPLVFGSPGGAAPRRGSPALYVDHNGGTETLLISAKHTHAGLNSSVVTIFNETTRIQTAGTAANDTDDLGQPCTTVDVSGFLGAIPSDRDSLWCNWINGAGNRAYGILADDGTSPLRGAGEVMQWMLRRSSIRWDASRIAALASWANQYQLDTYIMAEPAKRVSPLEWVQDVLLPMLPVSTSIEAAGLYLTPWRFTASASDAVASLVAGNGGNCDRVGAVNATQRDEVATTVEVGYEVDAAAMDPRETLTYTGDPAILAAVVDAIDDPSLREAWRIYGASGRRTVTFEADAVREATTAGRIAAWKAKQHGTQRVTAAYDVDQWPGGSVNPGDVVLVTDGQRGWTDRPAIVHATEWTDRKRVQMEVHIPALNRGAAG